MQETQPFSEDEKQVSIQQNHQMDTSIVCLMMSRGTMRHALLVAEVISRLQARFIPTAARIKKRIEALIEQEYLRRDVNNHAIYHYN